MAGVHESSDGVVRRCVAKTPETCKAKSPDGEPARHWESYATAEAQLAEEAAEINGAMGSTSMVSASDLMARAAAVAGGDSDDQFDVAFEMASYLEDQDLTSDERKKLDTAIHLLSEGDDEGALMLTSVVARREQDERSLGNLSDADRIRIDRLTEKFASRNSGKVKDRDAIAAYRRGLVHTELAAQVLSKERSRLRRADGGEVRFPVRGEYNAILTPDGDGNIRVKVTDPLKPQNINEGRLRAVSPSQSPEDTAYLINSQIEHYVLEKENARVDALSADAARKMGAREQVKVIAPKAGSVAAGRFAGPKPAVVDVLDVPGDPVVRFKHDRFESAMEFTDINGFNNYSTAFEDGYTVVSIRSSHLEEAVGLGMED